MWKKTYHSRGILLPTGQATLRKTDLGKKEVQGLEADSNPLGNGILAFQVSQMWSRRETCTDSKRTLSVVSVGSSDSEVGMARGGPAQEPGYRPPELSCKGSPDSHLRYHHHHPNQLTHRSVFTPCPVIF